jgi:hypothetical protein
VEAQRKYQEEQKKTQKQTN